MFQDMFPGIFNNTDYTYFFFFGFLIQAALMLGSKFVPHLKDFLTVIIISFIGFIPSKNELSGPYYILLHWYAYWLIFVLIFSLQFRKTIFPVITEVSSAVSTIILAYVYFTSSFQFPILSIILGISISAQVLLLFINGKIDPHLKLISYLWYLVVNIWLSLYFLSQVVLNFSTVHTLPVIQQIIFGMSAMILAVRSSGIYYMLPDKSSGFKDVYEHAEVLVSKYSDKQNGIIHNITILLGLGIILYLQHFYLHLSMPSLIAVTLLTSQLVERKMVIKN